MITTILLFTVLFLILLSWISIIRDAYRLKINGPFPLPIIGNAHLFMVDSANFLKLLENLSRSYGRVFYSYLLSKRYVLITDPKVIEAVLSSTELISKGRSYEYLKPWLGEGLLTAQGLRWKTHRKFLTPTLHFNVLQNFLPVFYKNDRVLRNKIRQLADGRQIDLFPLIALATLDNVTESIMAVNMNAQTDTESKYVKAIETLSRIISTRMRNVLIWSEYIFNLLPLKKQQDKVLRTLHEQSNSVIEARRRELEKSNAVTPNESSDLGIKNKHAFLDLLLLAEVNGTKIQDKHVREEVDTFMFEGHDTTTSGIVFCLYCISKNAYVQEKLFQEQKDILKDDLERDPTYAELQKMKYLEMVIKESLRLYPPVPLIERSIRQDCEVAGITLPANTSVIISFFHLHRNPNLYKDPFEFRPERFDTSIARNPFSWLPFSAGPRNCIGQKFAMLELKIAVAGIIRHFKLSPADVDPELSADLILRSNTGVKIKAHPRT